MSCERGLHIKLLVLASREDGGEFQDFRRITLETFKGSCRFRRVADGDLAALTSADHVDHGDTPKTLGGRVRYFSWPVLRTR